MTKHLRGTEVVLSFIVGHLDPEGIAQKNLVDACIAARVKRFAPSEWSIASNSGSAMYRSKDIVSAYLRQVNKDKKRLEFCLFQPGLFLDYLIFPHSTTKHAQLFCTPWDLQNRRAIIPEGPDFPLVLTTVGDLVKVVVEAVTFQGTWPERGGICGNKFMNSEFLKLAESIRGEIRPIHVEVASNTDIDNLSFKTSWIPQANHASLSPEERASISKQFLGMILTAVRNGAFGVTEEWNQLLPNVEMTKAETFLRMIWKD
ncbi:uncharacterized protein A1O9_07264 [Exophiala aquamarina CBS 119918]|uniref:Uncharacterized protein n=1 Tax=Exophiala aquamarina CBS 119918 TaxID=1182545 RepID=A0A072PAC9_9EURO|nr:uncharacterized protein A1O9_07264 [Exophiala aquamarina CBS 119918]KEF57074.1 hypothetical protein A1O9_07264 [Exophiala aquamarina CBS 119918]